jgi:hypothetical protein
MKHTKPCKKKFKLVNSTSGSINNGHLRELATIMALSVEKESFGRPEIIQSLIWTGLPKRPFNEKVGERGRFSDLQNPIHISTISCRKLTNKRED